MQILAGIIFSVGLFFVLSDLLKIPYFRTSKAVIGIAKKQKKQTSYLDLLLSSLSEFLSKHIRISEYKRASLETDLRSAGLDITPEKYRSDAIVKAGVIGIFAVPFAFIFPLLCPVIVFLAVYMYSRESRKVSRMISGKREMIEYDLPRFVSSVEKTLIHSRDVLYMIDSFRENCSPALSEELAITSADMKSGNYEDALMRLETRVGSPMMSDICRGLISVIRGDDARMYFSSLGIRFGEIRRNRLKMQANKVPKKVRRLSMALLFCFMLTYVVVIVEQVVQSVGMLFG